METENLLCTDHEADEHAVIWDDSALIKACDKALALAKEEIDRRIENNVLNKNDIDVKLNNIKQKKRHKQWSVGDFCQAKYEEDGLWYEAVIVSIMKWKDACKVQFVGYKNEQETLLSKLRKSRGEKIRQQQERKANSDDEYQNKHDTSGMEQSEDSESYQYISQAKNSQSKHNSKFIPPLPDFSGLPWNFNSFDKMNNSTFFLPNFSFPPPPFPSNKNMSDDALYSMLMSWYMTGYHTGFYHGLRYAETNVPNKNMS